MPNHRDSNSIITADNNFNFISPSLSDIPKFNNKLRLGILASGKGSNFEALFNATMSSILDAQICLLVVNNPDSLALKRAKRLSVPHQVINHQDYKNRHEHEVEIINSFKKSNVEAIVMAGWMRIVTPTLINAFPDRLINIHPSLLPSFRGINAIEKALTSGVKITGCTVHLVKEEVDSGPILIQAAVPILDNDSVNSLSLRIQKQEHIILPLGVAIAGEKWRSLDIMDKMYS